MHAVPAEFKLDGVPRSAIHAQGYGETLLRETTPDEVREPQNRRLRITISQPMPVAPPQSRNCGDIDERGTPVAIFARYGKPCTLDVAASPALAQCRDYFTWREDGLKQRWHGVVWLNPPFSNIARWVRRAFEYAQAGGTVIALLPVWTDAQWFRDYAPFGTITLLRKRVLYVGASGSAPFPSMVVEWSPESLKQRRGILLNAQLEAETDARGGGRCQGSNWTKNVPAFAAP